VDRRGGSDGVGYAAGVRLAVSLLTLVVAGCSGEFLSTTPSNPGVATAPAEVVALAGPDLVVLEGSRVVLAGGASRALLGEPDLAWSQREGPLVTLSNPSSPSPTFVAPLGPARLVFTLEAAADDLRDLDEVVVHVVTASTDVVQPAVFALPADRVAAVDEVVRFETPWTGAGQPVVSMRCPTLSPEPFGTLRDGTLIIEVAPRNLPCPVVVEDVSEAPGGGAPVAGRAVVILWPEGTATPAATRARAPATVAPGSEVAIDLDPGAQAFVVDGTPLPLEPLAAGVRFTAPRRPGRLTLLAETRQGSAGGGTRVIAIEVGAGAGNTAPVVDGGPDLRVRPGARFRIAPDASDDDGDALAVDIRQVLGLAAVRAEGGVDVLIAPTTSGLETLLFHVVADDGVAESPPEPVRVVVDPVAENLPPVLTVPPELYVTPGAAFVVDGSSARDPDAGLVVGWRIAQSPDDAVQLLPEAVDTPSVALTAGAAGERYHFLISVVDDGGLEASASVVVIVEEAGPYVDPVRGSDDANGTDARPFRSVDEALVTAARHRFPALRLVGSPTPIPVPGLPDGLGLEGGWTFDADADRYVATDEPTTVGLDAGLSGFAGVGLSRLDIVAGPAQLRLQRRVDVVDVSIGDGIALAVAPNARVRGDAVDLFDVEVEGTLELIGATIRGGLRGRDAVIDLGSGCRVLGREREVAVDVAGGVLRVEAGGEIAGGVVGLRVGDGAVVAFSGSIDITGDTAIGIEVDGGTLALEDATIRAAGATARGLALRSGTVGGHSTVFVSGDTVIGVDADVAIGAVLGGRIEVVGVVGATGVRGVDVALERLRLRVEAPSAVGVEAAVAALRASLVEVVGAGGRGVVAGRGELRHVTVRATGTAFIGASGLRVDNSLGLAPVAFGGDGVTAGIVGVLEGSDAGTCTTCVVGPATAVDEGGGLVPDDVLGAPNPFVDVGDPLLAVATDLDGLPIPQGPAPDLGARERPVPAPPVP
jgi:hypothetical protein